MKSAIVLKNELHRNWTVISVKKTCYLAVFEILN